MLLTTFALLVLVGRLPALTQEGADSTLLDTRLATVLQQNHLRGAVAIAVSKYLYALPKGDRCRRRLVAATTDGGCDISCRLDDKPVTSVAAMQLVERGRIGLDHRPGKRAAGSLSWGGINNTLFWIDPSRDVAGVLLRQFLPFVDPTALDMLDTFERGVYQLVQ